MNENLRYLSTKQACSYLGLKSQATLYRYIAAGLPVIKMAGLNRFDRLDIDKFMAEHKR